MPNPKSRIPGYQLTTSSSRAKTDQFYTSSLESSEHEATSSGEDSGQELTPRNPIQAITREEPEIDFRTDPKLLTPKPSKNSSKYGGESVPNSSTLHSRQSTSNMESVLECIPFFYGRKDGFEDPNEHIETIGFIVDEKYEPTSERNELVKRMAFRSRLKDQAAKWYQQLDSETRSNWKRLSTVFVFEFVLEARVESDPNKFFNQMYNLRQGKKPIAQYVNEAQTLYLQCPGNLQEMFSNQFVAGIADENKLDMVQLYLSSEPKITFPAAKAAVVRVYSRIGRPSPFDEKDEHSKKEITQNEVNQELVTFFRSLQTTAKQQQSTSKTVVHEYKPSSIPTGKQPSHDVTCHNCMKPGHFSTDCPLPQVSYKQKSLNRAKIEELQKEAKLGQQAPAASAAALQFFQQAVDLQQQQHPKVRGPLEETSGNPGRAQIRLPMTPVILKRGVSLADLGPHPKDVQAAAATRSGKATNTSNKENQPTRNSRVTKPVNKNELNKNAQRAVEQAAEALSQKKVSFVEEVDDSGNPSGREESGPMEGVTSAEWEGSSAAHSRIPQSSTQTDRTQVPAQQDQPSPPLPTQPRPSNSLPIPRRISVPKTSTVPPPTTAPTNTGRMPALFDGSSEPRRKLPKDKMTQDDSVGYLPKETVPINMAKDKDRFSVDGFLDAQVTMPIWQLLDRSPQIRAQLARAMASSKPTKRGKRPAMIATSIQREPPLIATEAHEEEDVTCLYLEAWINDTKVNKTLADNGAVVELINPELVRQLGLEIYEMEHAWTLQLADDGLAMVKQYVWAPVNVAGVEAIVRAFILGMGNIYDLLLSKRWMKRVRAVEDHGQANMVIQGKDGIPRVAHGQAAKSLDVEVICGPSVDEWETSLAEEELEKLAEELDRYDFVSDQGKEGRL